MRIYIHRLFEDSYLPLHRTMDLQLVMPRGHFLVVTGASILATAFTSLAMLFSLQGLATPGCLLPMTQVPGVDRDS